MSTIFMLDHPVVELELHLGFHGYLGFGHGVFFGVGGYVTGNLWSQGGLPFARPCPWRALFPQSWRLTIGYPLLRLRGVYFSNRHAGPFLATRSWS
jgi:branched-chain amino acid transport system permease protein